MSSDSVSMQQGLEALFGPRAETPVPNPAAPVTQAEMAAPLSPAAPQAADGDAVDPPPAPETEPVASLKDLAAKAGLEVKQLYGMELPGIEGLTLGQIKDRAKELLDVDATREVVETERAGLRQERLRWKQELAAAQQAGLRDYSEQELVLIGQLLQRHAEAEANTIMAAVPEWSNQATLKADFEGMSDLLKPYGFSKTDVAQALEGDARFTLFMKDQLDRNRRLKAAEAKVKAAPKKLQAPAGNPATHDALQRIYSDPKSSSIDRGLAALLQGVRK